MDFKKLKNLWRQTVGSDVDFDDLDVRQTFKPRPPQSPPPKPFPKKPFETKELIAKGGGGEIYRARQGSLERDVALKKLRHGMAAPPSLRANFVAEGIVLGQLEHPNIVPIYALDDTDNELTMAMRLVGGQTWKELLDERPIDMVVHLEILLQACNAIAFAHSRGIIHNDLKPENVMVGQFGEVIVLDWGLAVSMEQGEEPADGRARIRSRESIQSPCGTPAYMAPELALGEGTKVGPWTDVYLFGAVLYEILAGHAPHDGGDFMTVVERAAASAVPEFGEEVPEALAAICRKAMALDPAARFQSIPALQEELRRFLEHRESIELARAATTRLGELRTALATSPGGRDDGRIHHLFGECRFGFQQALRVWKGNDVAARGRREAIELMVDRELGRGGYDQARSLLAELESPDPGLVRRAEELGRRREEERAELERLRREHDVTLGVGPRARLTLALATSWSALCLLHGLEIVPATPVAHVLLGLLFGGIILAGVIHGRKAFFSNRYNRLVGYVALYMDLAVVLHRAACYSLLGYDVQQTVALEPEFFCFLFGITGMTIDWRYYFPSAAFGMGAIGAMAAPETAWFWLAGSIFVGLMALSLSWFLLPRAEDRG